VNSVHDSCQLNADNVCFGSIADGRALDTPCRIRQSVPSQTTNAKPLFAKLLWQPLFARTACYIGPPHARDPGKLFWHSTPALNQVLRSPGHRLNRAPLVSLPPEWERKSPGQPRWPPARGRQRHLAAASTPPRAPASPARISVPRGRRLS
jgi:hypothetical protein